VRGLMSPNLIRIWRSWRRCFLYLRALIAPSERP